MGTTVVRVNVGGTASGAPAAAAPPDVTNRSRGIAAVSITTVIWGLVPLVFKETDMPTLAFATYRLWMGVLVYAVVFALTGRRVSVAVLRVCALGGVFFAFDIAFTFSAFRLTSIANATIIGALAPVFITLGAARWFHERVERRDLFFVGASFAGVVLVAVGSAGSPTWSPLGDAFAAASVLSWTCYWLFSKRARARTEVGALEYMACVMTVAAVIMTVLALAFGQSLSLPTRTDWGWIWVVTIFPGFIGHSLISWSHRHLEAWLGSLITQLMPVIATAAGWIVLAEVPTALTIAGGLVVVAATAAIMIRAGRQAVSIGEGLSAPALAARPAGPHPAMPRSHRPHPWRGAARGPAATQPPTTSCNPGDTRR